MVSSERVPLEDLRRAVGREIAELRDAVPGPVRSLVAADRPWLRLAVAGGVGMALALLLKGWLGGSRRGPTPRHHVPRHDTSRDDASRENEVTSRRWGA